MTKKKPKKRGPPPDTLKIEGDWRDVMGRVIRKPKPPGGWSKRPKKKTGEG